VFVVDRIVLEAIHEVADVRDLDDGQAVVRQQRAEAGEESSRVVHVRQHIVADHGGRRSDALAQRARHVEAEELVDGLNAVGAGQLGDVAGGLHPQRPYAEIGEAAEQAAIVARDLDDQPVLTRQQVRDCPRILLLCAAMVVEVPVT
jgi:hypothetical protein